MPKLVERRCGYCGGTGKVEVGDFIKSTKGCPVCKQYGKVRVPSNYQRCPVCSGSGKRDIGEFVSEWVHCKNCQGTGWSEPPPAYR